MFPNFKHDLAVRSQNTKTSISQLMINDHHPPQKWMEFELIKTNRSENPPLSPQIITDQFPEKRNTKDIRL